MTETELFNTNTDDTQEQILHAAFIVLQANGYDNLSIQAIADEAGLEKSSIYYHYTNKDELLLAFLQHLMEHISTELQTHPGRTPIEQLRYLVDQSIPDADGGTEHAEGPRVETIAAVVQTRSQAVHRPEYRDRITKLEDVLRTELAGIISDAIAAGYIANTDPDTVVETLITLLVGAFERRVTVADVEPQMLRGLIHDYIDQIVTNETE